MIIITRKQMTEYILVNA